VDKIFHVTVPFVSVVIPTHNRRELLKNTIESLFNQSYPKDRYEIIIIDNSSNDGTKEMVISLQEKSLRILRYYYKENRGPGSARNLGITKSKGVIIAFTDSDCVADQNWLKNGVSKITESIGIVQGKTMPDPDQSQRTLQHTMEVMSEDCFYQTCNIFYRKELLDHVGGFSSEFCGLNKFGRQKGGEDTDLAWRIKECGWKSVFANDAIIYHHVFILTSLKAVIKCARLHVIFTLAHNIKKHPAIRESLLFIKIFKSKQRFFFYILMLSLFPGMLMHWGFFFLGTPYVIRLIRVSFSRRSIQSYHRGLALFFIIIFIELIESVLSICASLLYRTIIL